MIACRICASRVLRVLETSDAAVGIVRLRRCPEGHKTTTIEIVAPHQFPLERRIRTRYPPVHGKARPALHRARPPV
jgi:hypothetical protein